MTPPPFTAAEEYERRIGAETQRQLEVSIEARIRELQEDVSRHVAQLVVAQQEAGTRVQQAEAAAAETRLRIQRDTGRRNVVVALVSLGFLVAASVVTLNLGAIIGFLVLGGIAGGLVYTGHRRSAAVAGMVGLIASIVVGYYTAGLSPGAGSGPSSLWGLYALLYLLLLASIVASFYSFSNTKAQQRVADAAVAKLRQAVGAEIDSRRTEQGWREAKTAETVAGLRSVIPMWHAGGPEAEQAARTLIDNGMTREAGAIRAHQRKLAQIQYQDQEVSDRAQVLREANAAQKASAGCPRCSAPRTSRNTVANGLVQCEYCGLVYQPFEPTRFV